MPDMKESFGDGTDGTIVLADSKPFTHEMLEEAAKAVVNNFGQPSAYWYRVVVDGVQVVEYFPITDKLDDFPYLTSLDHLKRTNRYRRRMGQRLINLSDDDKMKLLLTGD